jgi:hypothetical protein
MPQIGPHRGRQREVLGRRAVISRPGKREPEPELRVIIARAGVHDPAEAAGRLRIAPRVELCAPERLQDAARVGLGRSGTLKELSRRSGAAAP